MRAVERAAGGGVARAVVAQHRAVAVLDLDARDGRAASFSIQPSSAISAAGNGESIAARLRELACRRATVSARSAATATASSAVSCSTASSQCGSGRGSSSSRLRERSDARAPRRGSECSASTASTSRSRKRRRSEAGPVNSRPSPASARRRADDRRRRSPRRPARGRCGTCRVVGASRRVRRLDAGAERGKPERALDLGTTPPRSRRPRAKATSSSVARRRPRPGASNEIASSRLVLPAPFGPTSTTGRCADVDLRRVIAAEIASASGGGCGRRS